MERPVMSDDGDFIRLAKTVHLNRSDIGMPNLDGYDLIRRIHAMESPANAIPAIAVTAFARPEDRQRILEHGFQFHLGKPLSRSDLVAAAGAVLGRL